MFPCFSSLELSREFQEECYSIALHPSGLYILVGFSDKLRLMNLLIDEIRMFKEFTIRGCREVGWITFNHGVNSVSFIVLPELMKLVKQTNLDKILCVVMHNFIQQIWKNIVDPFHCRMCEIFEIRILKYVRNCVLYVPSLTDEVPAGVARASFFKGTVGLHSKYLYWEFATV